MKKFVVIARVGNHNNGAIECSVKDVELIAENDNKETLATEYACRPTEYKDNGKWYSYKVMSRAEARTELRRFNKI
jgi:hypothetical protein